MDNKMGSDEKKWIVRSTTSLSTILAAILVVLSCFLLIDGTSSNRNRSAVMVDVLSALGLAVLILVNMWRVRKKFNG